MRESSEPSLYLALIHHPVVNKRGAVIASAVTNLDLHDIARAARTYGARAFYVVTPLADQQVLAQQIVDHWTRGPGASYNPIRHRALSIIRVRSSLAEAIAEVDQETGRSPKMVATCAREHPGSMAAHRLRDLIMSGRPVMILFGTAWGLAPEVMTAADYVMTPIHGVGDYNHLSVRSAAAIILDRLMGRTTP